MGKETAQVNRIVTNETMKVSRRRSSTISETGRLYSNE